MSVFTPINQAELCEFLTEYSVGEFVSYEGISAGIENTNFFVTTTEGQFVLTIFEQLVFEELPYFLNIMAFLSEHDVPSAHPIANKQQQFLVRLKDKPAALVQRLSGKSVEEPTVAHCESLGKALGRFHTNSQHIKDYRENWRGPHWWQESTQALLPHLNAEDAATLKAEIAFQATYQHSHLPQGVIHADLFRDNALFVDNTLTGIIDFYYACNDALIYDVDVTVNDWCSYEDGSLNIATMNALLKAYQSERRFEADEKAIWGVMLRASALRFWLSRLYDLHFPRPGEMTHTKDPNVFSRILHNRVKHFSQLTL